MLKFAVSISTLLLLGACTNVYEGGFKLPSVYRINIQQGNVIEQQMLDKLKPGMNQNQVRFIMGTPTMVDPFHNDRWDYVYTFSQDDKERKQRKITLYFKDDRLAYLDGDVVTGLRKPPTAFLKERKSVEVPLRKKKRETVLGRLLNALPFVGDDDDLITRQKTAEPRPPEVTDPVGVEQGSNEPL